VFIYTDKEGIRFIIYISNDHRCVHNKFNNQTAHKATALSETPCVGQMIRRAVALDKTYVYKLMLGLSFGNADL